MTLLLFPVPFQIFMAMMFAAFWQNDADFVLGNVKVVDAVLVDRGSPHHSRGMPRYYPTFRLADGQLLTVENPAVAPDLPPVDQAVQLRCGSKKPALCKMPGIPDLDPVSYGIAAVWSLLTLLMTWALWGIALREWRGRSRPR